MRLSVSISRYAGAAPAQTQVNQTLQPAQFSVLGQGAMAFANVRYWPLDELISQSVGRL